MAKKPRKWTVGQARDSHQLVVELGQVNQDTAVFIERRSGGLVVISLAEAEHLIEVLPQAIAQARKADA